MYAKLALTTANAKTNPYTLFIEHELCKKDNVQVIKQKVWYSNNVDIDSNKKLKLLQPI